MKKTTHLEDKDYLRKKIIGLGETSAKKVTILNSLTKCSNCKKAKKH